MAERAPKLQWEEAPGQWRAKVSGVRLAVFSTEYGMCWDAHDGVTFLDGVGANQTAAMCDAEDAAMKLLREGVEALGGRVLTGEQVALVVEALEWCAGDQPRSKQNMADAMNALAKEMRR